MVRARRGVRAVAAFSLVVAVAACGGGDGDGSTAETVAGVPAAGMEDAVLGLCETRDTAATDVQSARTSFYDRSHEPLHALAGALEPVDRPLAARLLEAKEAVEAGLASGSPALTADVDRLLEATRAGLVRLSAPSPGCP